MPATSERLLAAAIATVTVHDVPIVGTGSYRLSTGPHAFTEEELADAVAAQDDSSLSAPRLRIGHTDTRTGFDGLRDGEPALGVVRNLRLSDDRQELIADFDGVPEAFREVAAVGYPGLSIEGHTNYTAPSGRRYRLVITDVALLGAQQPAVTSLDDLRAYFQRATAMSAASFVLSGSAEALGAQRVLRNLSRRLAAAASPTDAARIAAEADIEDLRLRYYETLGPGQQMQWWVRSIRLADEGNLYLVVDDGDGHRFRVDVTPGTDEVTFSEPVPVQERYVSIAAGMAAPEGGRVLATYNDREGNHPEGGSMNDEQRRALARRLGQPEDTEESALLSLLTAAPAAEGEGSGGQPAGAAPGAPTPPPGQPAAPPAAPEPAAAPAAPEPVAAREQGQGGGVRVLDEATYNEWESRMRELTEQQERQERERRDQIVARAVEEGRIPPARRSHWRQAFDSDAAGTETLLAAPPEAGGIMPNLIPVIARGVAPSDEESEKNERQVMDAFVEHHFGNVIASGQRARRNTRVLHRGEV